MSVARSSTFESSTIAPDPSARPRKDAEPPDDEVDVWSIVVDDNARLDFKTGSSTERAKEDR